MGKYGNAIGIWHIEINGANLDITPKEKDNLRLMKILMDKRTKEDNSLLFERFAEWMVNLIKRDVPPENEEEMSELRMFVEYNLKSLFEEAIVKFGWVSKEQMDKLKSEVPDFLKQKMEENV